MAITDPSPAFQERPSGQGIPPINQGASEHIRHANHLERFSKSGNSIIKPWQLSQNKWILKTTFHLGPSKSAEC